MTLGVLIPGRDSDVSVDNPHNDTVLQLIYQISCRLVENLDRIISARFSHVSLYHCWLQ